MRNRLPLSRKHQRGAILIMTAAFIVAAVALLALAVDTGRLYAAQQKLQSAANLAALDAARATLGCRGQVDKNQIVQSATDIVNDSVERNYQGQSGSDFLGADNPVVVGAAVDRNDDNIREFESNETLISNGLPNANGSGESEDVTNSAVRVTLSHPFPKSLLAVGSAAAGSRGPMTATAAAQSIPQATFHVGSTLLDVDSGLLGALGIDAGVFDQGNLADATISLGQLEQDLNVGSSGDGEVDELLSASQPLENLISVIDGAAVGANGTGGVLGGLQDALSADLAGQQVTLGDVLTNAGSLGETAQVDTKALADALLKLAISNRNTPITIPLDLGLLGLTNGSSAKISILQPPKIAAGRPGHIFNNSAQDFRTRASSAQVLVQLDLKLDINLAAASIEGNLPIYIRSGSAFARLQRIECANAQNKFHQVSISADAASADLGIGEFNDLTVPNPSVTNNASLDLDAVLGLIPLLRLDASAGPVNLGQASANPLLPLFESPAAPGDDNSRAIAGGLQPGSAIVDLLGTLEVELDPSSLAGLGFLLRPLVNTLLAGLGNLTTPVGDLLNRLAVDDTLNSLLGGLGIDLGNAIITLDNVDVKTAELIES